MSATHYWAKKPKSANWLEYSWKPNLHFSKTTDCIFSIKTQRSIYLLVEKYITVKVSVPSLPLKTSTPKSDFLKTALCISPIKVLNNFLFSEKIQFSNPALPSSQRQKNDSPKKPKGSFIYDASKRWNKFYCINYGLQFFTKVSVAK